MRDILKGERTRGRAAFTLLELVIVLFIIGLASALAAPSVYKGFSGVKSKAAARGVAAAMKQARNKAVSTGVVWYAEAGEKRVAVVDGASRAVVREFILPEELALVRVGGEVTAFYPAGGSSGGTFELRGLKDGRAVYRVVVEPSTGDVRIYPL